MSKDDATLDRNKIMMESFLEKLDKDISAIDTFLSPECRIFLPGTNLPTDRDGFRDFVGELYSAFPDLSHEISRQIAQGDEVASIVIVRGTHKGKIFALEATGKEVIFTDIIIARIEDGKFTDLWAQFDVLGLVGQLKTPAC